jgi:hypothetical protein
MAVATEGLEKLEDMIVRQAEATGAQVAAAKAAIGSVIFGQEGVVERSHRVSCRPTSCTKSAPPPEVAGAPVLGHRPAADWPGAAGGRALRPNGRRRSRRRRGVLLDENLRLCLLCVV